MGWMTEKSGFDSRQVQDTLSPSAASKPDLRHIQSSIQWILGKGRAFPAVKEAGALILSFTYNLCISNI
jgi:hypothetical protein